VSVVFEAIQVMWAWVFSRTSINMGPVVENTDVVFDRVVTNVGDAYNPETGKFVAPADGVYQFNVVISAQGRQKV